MATKNNSGSGMTTVPNGKHIVVTLPLPQPVQPGQIDYYRLRNEDFLCRHPTAPPAPPDYYIDYGDKYAHRFSKELAPKLSLEGQRWVQKTLRLLQEKIEARLTKDPARFDELERSPGNFKEFVYDTHSDAYLEAGLADLPDSDLWKIFKTPDWLDVFTWSGLVEIIETGYGMLALRNLSRGYIHHVTKMPGRTEVVHQDPVRPQDNRQDIYTPDGKISAVP